MPYNGRLRIKIGASVDASVANAFTQIEKRAKQARDTIAREFKGLGEEMAKGIGKVGHPALQGPNGFESAAKSVERASRGMGLSIGQVADGASKRFQRMAQDLRKLTPELNVVSREADRALAQIERDRARQLLGLPVSKAAEARASGRFGMRGMLGAGGGYLGFGIGGGGPLGFGLGAAGYLGRAGMGLVSELAGDIGVETRFGEMFRKNVDEESLAQKISNSGYMPGQAGANGQLVDKEDILSQARYAAEGTATSRGDVLEGLRDFVAKTGDLKLGRDLLVDMAIMARATGTNMADMTSAAAEVSNHLGDMKDKGNVVKTVMQQIAGQGKLGAVEIRDMASQMAKIAATAPAYVGGAAQNIAILGVLAQESKLRGGSASATQAATSVAALARDLVKSTTVRNWKKFGLNQFSDSTETTLKDPREIIIEALQKTHGNREQMNKLFPNSASMRAVTGFANIYTEAGGGARGVQAVNDEFERLHEAQLTAEEVMRAFNESMQTSQAKVVTFNEKMADVAENAGKSLLPALEKLAPVVLGMAEAAGQFAAYVANGINHVMGIDDADDKNTAQQLDWDASAHKELLGKFLKTGRIRESPRGGFLREYSADEFGKLEEVAKNDQAKWKPVVEHDKRRVSDDETVLKALMANESMGGDHQSVVDAAAKLKEDQATLDRHTHQQDEMIDVLKGIRDAVERSEARLVSGPPDVKPGGTAAPNSPEPDKP